MANAQENKDTTQRTFDVPCFNYHDTDEYFIGLGSATGETDSIAMKKAILYAQQHLILKLPHKTVGIVCEVDSCEISYFYMYQKDNYVLSQNMTFNSKGLIYESEGEFDISDIEIACQQVERDKHDKYTAYVAVRLAKTMDDKIPNLNKEGGRKNREMVEEHGKFMDKLEACKDNTNNQNAREEIRIACEVFDDAEYFTAITFVTLADTNDFEVKMYNLEYLAYKRAIEQLYFKLVHCYKGAADKILVKTGDIQKHLNHNLRVKEMLNLFAEVDTLKYSTYKGNDAVTLSVGVSRDIDDQIIKLNGSNDNIESRKGTNGVEDDAKREEISKHAEEFRKEMMEALQKYREGESNKHLQENKEKP
jgi:hypothetical protein